MNLNTRLWPGVFLLALLTGCDQAPETEAPRQADVAETVAEVAQRDGESADETGDCGRIGWLLDALPGQENVDGLEQSYRGCESPMTANLQYEDDQRGVYYTLSVLQADMADLPGQADAWQGLLDLNRRAIEELMRTQRELVAVASQPVAEGTPELFSEEERARFPREVKLPDGSAALVYNDGADWSLVSLLKDRYALRIDLLNSADRLADTAAAQDALLARVADIDFARLK